jgi:SAM-dependent methyltransferase
VLIVDGEFSQSPSVWHRQILDVLHRETRRDSAITPLTQEPLEPAGSDKLACSARPPKLLVTVAEPRPTAQGAESLETGPGYRLAAADREAAEDERLSLLEQLFDPVSRRRRAMVQRGWRCLEIGAGRGSMAMWLADQAGPAGQVVATDIDTGYLRRLGHPNLEVLEHNIREDPLEVLGPGSFDLVCSRFTLIHLVGRQEAAISQMTKCLRPGGWLIDEDAEWGTAVPVDPAHPLYDGYRRAWRDGGWFSLVLAVTTRRLRRSCRHCLSATVFRTYAMRRPRRWCAEAHPGRDGSP